MEKLTQFLNMVDKSEEHVGKHKNFYMCTATILLSVYMIMMVKPTSIDLEIILALAIAIIPIMAMISAIIDCITLKRKNFYAKVATRVGLYMAIYFVLNLIQNKFF